MPLQFQPMPLQRRATAFDDPDWIYELKMDGFRALAIVEHGRAHLLSGIVAKQKSAPYVTEREQSTWFKILNREYSQKDGREELFERERHQEPVAGWHSCALACAELEEVG